MTAMARARTLCLVGFCAVLACRSTPYREVDIDLGAGDAGTPISTDGRKPALRFSVAAMQSPRATHTAYSHLVERVGRLLGSSIEFIQRRTYLEVNDLLAAFATLGIVVTHAVHLAIGNRVATRALSRDLETLGNNIASAVVEEAVDAVLVDDVLALNRIVSRAASSDVAYCFIVRGSRILASSFRGGSLPILVSLRGEGAAGEGPVVVRSGSKRILDVARPILAGSGGVVRLGIDMRILDSVRRDLSVSLGLVALAVIAMGIVAALLVGRMVARPVASLVAAVERFDPTREVQLVPPSGGVEVEHLAVRLNEMMVRVKGAHDVMERARQKEVETERLVALGTLVAGLAHEINNPIAGIKNCQRRLARGDLDAGKRAEYLDLIAEGLDRIEEVVGRLLDLARPQPLSLRQVAVGDIVRDMARLVQPLLEKRGIAWVEEGSETDARVVADRGRIRQAVLNLVLNAAYVTADGGSIRTRVRRRPGLVGIAIEDDGPGIPPAIRDRILDPFFSTKPPGEGTGLGLSVTKTVVGAHGGDLTFEFPETGGTVATIWLRETLDAVR